MSDIIGLCSICGKHAKHSCKVCGKPVCGEHYDRKSGMCSSCSSGRKIARH